MFFQNLILFERISEAAAHWQSVSTKSFPFDFQRLRAIEETMVNDVMPIYATVNSNGTLATFYFQYIPFRSQYFDSPFKKFTLTKKLESLVVDNSFCLLVCGNLIAINVPGYHFESLSLDTNRHEVLQSVLKILQDKYKPSITTIKDVDSDLLVRLTENGYADYGTDLTMALQLAPSWNSLEDYAKSLKHKYAQRARKIQRDAKDIERRNITIDEFKQHHAAFQRLFLNVTKRQSIRILIPPIQYFENLLIHDSRFSIVGYFLNHQPVLFSTYFNYGNNTEVHYVAIDYKANEQYHLYFNLLFDSITIAIQNRSSTLELGRTARQAKAIIGAKPVYFKAALKVHNPVSDWVYNTLRKRFAKKAGADWQPRHPFKLVES